MAEYKRKGRAGEVNIGEIKIKSEGHDDGRDDERTHHQKADGLLAAKLVANDSVGGRHRRHQRQHRRQQRDLQTLKQRTCPGRRREEDLVELKRELSRREAYLVPCTERNRDHNQARHEKEEVNQPGKQSAEAAISALEQIALAKGVGPPFTSSRPGGCAASRAPAPQGR